ncbi:MAG TPA: molybdopterin-dependent oxidoreductase [Vicinamibacteria bacterium]|nr:molybdopterin-dependent oxidoreductase [Vicinamibacteria bacterium]
MKFDRRRFLGFTVGAAAGTAVGVPVSRTYSDVMAAMNPLVYPPRGTEDFALSVCSLCPGGCGVRARRVGGRVVKLDGNPFHPVNGGRLCPKGQAALQLLYHPDRVATPLRRTGAKGSPDSFEPASWNEALEQIGGRLRSLRQEGKPESLISIRGPLRATSRRLLTRFLEAFGTPNDIELHRGEDAAALALELSQGVRAMPAYDLKSAEYVLSLGSALLEAWSSPVNTMRSYGEFRQGRAGRRGKLVQVEPRLSVTAAAADEWIAVAPGTEGIFALGVAAVLASEGLYDRDFVSERTIGFDDVGDEDSGVHEGLRTILERDYTLESVTARTGVPVNTILRIAREFATSRGPLATGPRKGPLLPGSLLGHLAAQYLNALTGNIDQPGGLLLCEEVPLSSWPELPADPVAAKGRSLPRLDDAEADDGLPRLHSEPERLAEAVRRRSPYAAEMLLLANADPVFATVARESFTTALDRIPFVVAICSIPNDSTFMADWILPESHFLESWELDTTPPGVPFPLASLARPALQKPFADSKATGQIVLELAQQLGGEVAASFPWTNLEEVVRSDVERLYSARRGAVMGTAFDEAWVLLMEGAGWWAPGYRSADELWERMHETGGWWDPFYDHSNWQRVFRTSSGRHEFRPDLLTRLVERAEAVGSTPPTDGMEDGEESGADQKLSLVLFEPLPVAAASGAELPFLQAILDPGLEERWETWVEVHPDTGRARGLSDRDWVEVSSAVGRIEARLRLTPRIVPGVAAVPVGLGKRSGGRWARGLGANPLHLISPDENPLGAISPTGATQIELRLLNQDGQSVRETEV